MPAFGGAENGEDNAKSFGLLLKFLRQDSEANEKFVLFCPQVFGILVMAFVPEHKKTAKIFCD